MVHAEREFVVANSLVQTETVLAVAAVNGLGRVGESRKLGAAALVGHIVRGDLEVDQVDHSASLGGRLADKKVADPDILLWSVGGND